MNRTTLGTALLLLSSLLPSCAPSQPPRWAEGGAQLVIAPARWERGDDDPVEIQADGKVLEGGKLRFTIDRVGRVTDDDYDAFAILLPDGHIVGTDDHALGYVGVSNATPPLSAQAWLSLLPDGRVMFFHPDGDRGTLGQWTGCNGPNRRSCTLVTQIFLVQNLRMAPMYGPTFGVGVGVGVGF